MRVVFPEVSRQQDDPSKLKDMYLNVVSKLAFITLPICFGLALVAYEFIYVLYGEKWMDVVPVLQLLLIAGGISSISVVGGPVLRGIGRPDLEMKLSVFSFVSFTALVLIGVKHGLLAVAIAECCRVVLVETTRLWLIRKHLGVSVRAVCKQLLPTVQSLVLMIIVLYGMNLLEIEINVLILFVLKIAIGAAAYIAGSFIFNKSQSQWILNYVKKKQAA